MLGVWNANPTMPYSLVTGNYEKADFIWHVTLLGTCSFLLWTWLIASIMPWEGDTCNEGNCFGKYSPQAWYDSMVTRNLWVVLCQKVPKGITHMAIKHIIGLKDVKTFGENQKRSKVVWIKKSPWTVRKAFSHPLAWPRPFSFEAFTSSFKLKIGVKRHFSWRTFIFKDVSDYKPVRNLYQSLLNLFPHAIHLASVGFPHAVSIYIFSQME